jgi:DNA-binding IclR family transcriptional regulator
MQQAAAALLQLLVQEDGLSPARACKRLGIARSELQRLLAALGDDPALGGLGLVELRATGDHQRLYLRRPPADPAA